MQVLQRGKSHEAGSVMEMLSQLCRCSKRWPDEILQRNIIGCLKELSVSKFLEDAPDQGPWVSSNLHVFLWVFRVCVSLGCFSWQWRDCSI